MKTQHSSHPLQQLQHLSMVISLAFGLVACGGDLENNRGAGGNLGNSSTPVDSTAPTAVLDQTNPVLGINSSLTITFSESMDTASLQFIGTLASEAASAVWSTTTVANDTLTIAPPANGWTNGAMRDLTIDAADAGGNPVSTITASYQIAPVFETFQAAEVVIGQGDFADNSTNRGGSVAANTFANPWGTTVSAADGKLFVSDLDNGRVVVFNNIPTASSANADFALGQPDLTSAIGFPASQSSYGYPVSTAIVNNKLAVADYLFSRVLIYNTIPSNGNALPDVVVGQSDFTSFLPGCGADSLQYPLAVTGTADGKLIVADALSHRVLIWNSVPTMNGQPADLVLGQSDFTHCTENDDNQDDAADATSSARTLSNVSGVWTDGTRLVVVDSGNNRVLLWNTFPTTNFQPADLVLGQSSFALNQANDTNQDGANNAAPDDRTLNAPASVHSNGSQLAVADSSNNRVLIWRTFPTTSFQPADVVIGQSDFTRLANNDDDQNGVANSSASARVLNEPAGVLFYEDKLLVTDTYNSRVLIFRSK